MIQGELLRWYARHRRDLPWRRTRSPYRIWLAETMLQQTRVETVVPYYRRFVRRFPSMASLARAPVDDTKTKNIYGYVTILRSLRPARRFRHRDTPRVGGVMRANPPAPAEIGPRNARGPRAGGGERVGS